MQKIAQENKAVMKFAKNTIPEMMEHVQQVSDLALSIYDGLKIPLKLGSRHRTLLAHAAMLHDIGWTKGQKSHHKTSKQIILEEESLPFSKQRRMLIGLIARYHRKSMPKQSHRDFSVLSENDQKTVSLLAGILRVADELDVAHENIVKGLTLNLKPKRLLLECETSKEWLPLQTDTLKKSDLLAYVLGKKVTLKWTASAN